MKISTPQRNVTIIYIDLPANGEQWVMFSADRHHDSIHCNRDLELRHLEKARERNAIIMDCGDLFCAMQGKYDPRASMDDIRREDVGEDYLDRIVTHAAEFYGPYADLFAVLGHGNHETSIRKRHGIDLTAQLVQRLNSEYGGTARPGLYAGYVLLRFSYGKSETKRIKYHHGAGGGGPVTRGVIQTNRQAVWMPSADIVVNGHTHDAWVVPVGREELTQRGRTRRGLMWFVRTPGYKDEFADGAAGFHNESWRGPKPIGCVWAHFTMEHDRIRTECIQDVE